MNFKINDLVLFVPKEDCESLPSAVIGRIVHIYTAKPDFYNIQVSNGYFYYAYNSKQLTKITINPLTQALYL